jgi:hypothetical protein
VPVLNRRVWRATDGLARRATSDREDLPGNTSHSVSGLHSLTDRHDPDGGPKAAGPSVALRSSFVALLLL